MSDFSIINIAKRFQFDLEMDRFKKNRITLDYANGRHEYRIVFKISNKEEFFILRIILKEMLRYMRCTNIDSLHETFIKNFDLKDFYVEIDKENKKYWVYSDMYGFLSFIDSINELPEYFKESSVIE